MSKQLTAVWLIFLCLLAAVTRTTAGDTIVDAFSIPKCTVSKSASTDREFDCLKGKVHVIQSEIISLMKKDGQFVKRQVTQERTITYDERGNKVEQVVYGFDYNFRKYIESRVVYTFDSNGRATGWEDYANGKDVPAKSTYIYDDKGQRIKQSVTNPDGTVRAILTLIYDSKGKNVEKRYDNSGAGMGLYNVVNSYDSKGNLIESVSYNAGGSVIHKVRSDYDDKGNQIEVIAYSSNATGEVVRTSRNTFRYDKRGNMVERTVYDNNDAVQSRTSHEYSESGNLISSITYNAQGKILSKTSVSLEFDSHGNWVKYIFNWDRNTGVGQAEPYWMESRTITYY